ncbi:hypothetical protein ACN6MY_12250 [Peribacillus sp. B-H-3]|uniref:hypothetical protein n=1 Tax=Peribacillus sp. B-H-3 TaxID=3400420 RepID=UPI003B01B77F
MAFLINLYQYVPYWLGFSPIGVGSNQITTIKGVSNLGLMLGTITIGPFNEEFLFRYLLFVEAALLFANIPKDLFSEFQQHIIKHKKLYLICWIIVVNMFFGFAHGPSI